MPYRNLYKYKQFELKLNDTNSKGIIYESGKIKFLGQRRIAIHMFVQLCDSPEINKLFEHYLSEIKRVKDKLRQKELTRDV
jgi:hypothetical protein